jgi:hypothetical protein
LRRDAESLAGELEPVPDQLRRRGTLTLSGDGRPVAFQPRLLGGRIGCCGWNGRGKDHHQSELAQHLDTPPSLGGSVLHQGAPAATDPPWIRTDMPERHVNGPHEGWPEGLRGVAAP